MYSSICLAHNSADHEQLVTFFVELVGYNYEKSALHKTRKLFEDEAILIIFCWAKTISNRKAECKKSDVWLE